MNNFLLAFCFLIIFKQSNQSFLNNLCSEIYPKNAKNILLFLLNIHQKWSGKETCTNLNPDKFSNVLLMNYAINLINDDFNQSVPNGTLGIY